VDVPLTLLWPSEPAAPRPRLDGLARRLARLLGHAVEVYRSPAVGEGGPRRLVLLPLEVAPDPGLDRRLDEAVDALLSAGPDRAIHRGSPVAQDDLARLLGDRARQLAGRGAATAVVVIVGRGRASPGANAELARLARLVFEAHRFGEVGYAFLDLTPPGIAEVVARWSRLGARRVVLVPWLAFPGPSFRALTGQARAASAAAGIDVAVARPLASHPAFAWALVRRHLDALQAPPLGRPGDEAPYVNPALLDALRGPHGHAHGGGPLAALEARIAALLPERYRGAMVSPAPMAAADLARDADGRVAWDRTWQSFCELALAGGPPHRGALLEPPAREEILSDPASQSMVLAELERAIRAVTGLPVTTKAPPGWIGVGCDSEAMAIWLLRAIVVENVSARREGSTLFLPAGPRYTEAGEIRSVVTALAKSHHYWLEHSGRAAPPRRLPSPPGPLRL
jgi:sirohydrochlorin cobaltochelatase